MPKSAVNYRKPRRLSEEQRQAARERAGNLHSKGNKVLNEYQSYVNASC